MDIDEAWDVVAQAFAHYGKQIRPLKGARRKHIERLIAEGYGGDELAAAVHGYVHWHKGLDRKPDGFEPRQWFTPESVFRLEKLEMRIELGEAGAWRKPESAAERRERERREEYERERAKVLAERGGQLRAL